WFKKNDPLKYEFYGVDFIDEANRIWFIDINGIQYFDPVVQQFTSSSYEQLLNEKWTFAYYIAPDSSGNKLTVCPRITDGIYYFDKKTGQWTVNNFNCQRSIGRENIVVRGFAETNPGK